MNREIDHYRLLERLGNGGLGEIYKAEDLTLGRTVALKLLPPEWPADEEASQRLLDEARAAAALNHPHIATIYEAGEAEGLSYMAMEYVEGETAARRIAAGLMEMSIALEIAIQVTEALSAAHAHGLIHCDIKSSNIMLTLDGSVKVLDFGLARMRKRAWESGRRGDRERENGEWESGGMGDGEGPTGLPGSGVVMGTASYMSPEQARGEPLDARTDLFSLGVVLYELVAGQRPFAGESRAAVLRAILNDEPLPLRAHRDDLPLEFESLIRKALAKNRDERYPSADAMLADLIRLRSRLQPPSVTEDRGWRIEGKTREWEKGRMGEWEKPVPRSPTLPLSHSSSAILYPPFSGLAPS